jgi:hypothetical protein
MAAHPLRVAALGLLGDGLEHPRQRARVVTGARHDLGAKQVGLLFEVAAIAQEQRAETELRALRNHRARRAADDGAADGAGHLAELEPRVLRFRHVRGAMPQQHVRQLVRHHADHFAFRRRRLEHAAVDEHRSAGQRESVDLFQIQRRERILVTLVIQLRRRRCNQAVAHRRQVLRDALVANHRILLANLGGRFHSELHVLFWRELVLRQFDDGLRRGDGDRQAEGDKDRCSARDGHNRHLDET